MNTDSGIPPEAYLDHAFRLGLQYLASGRFAVAARLIPVSANLLHAIEMFLKGCLAQHAGFDNLPKGRNGHDLEKLCPLLKASSNNALQDDAPMARA
ncbi:hypothetical protein sS8_0087 [Methylocaldum marinum]|uniref:HEPN domain-containing protein n=1 Tax=Methylocaldum marinum TaxID=1432792 RepID=A0A286T737_9GAMM|nr:hypothetical protein [Methylocaldum marinum]BBA32056.1 hypothetical protein sS8_0087 [Methylocaldum marinum]